MVTPDSERMHMQFYESEAYYWLAVKRMAELLAPIDPAEGARLAAEAEAYRKDLLAAIDRSIALTPVVAGARRHVSLVHSVRPLRPGVRVGRLGLAALPGPRRRDLLGHGPVGRSR